MVDFDFILKEVGNNINLIAVTESWYKDNKIQQLSYLVAGFSLVTASRPERSAGGVAIYIYGTIWSFMTAQSQLKLNAEAKPLTLHVYIGLQEGNNNISILFLISRMNF
jgi:hypothetical protein